MNNANFEFNMNQKNPWAEMTSGAKVATAIAGLGVVAASLAASLFLAGAALFSGLVFATYRWISSQSNKENNEVTIIDSEVVETTQ